MVSGYKGPTQDMGVSSVCRPGGYNSRIIHSKQAAVSQYDALPHVWKKWLMMTNMCKPVDPSRSFADVLKEGPSKQQQVCPPLSKNSTSKIQTASKTPIPLKVQVPEVSRQWSPCEQGKSTYVQKLVDPTPYQVPCHNRQSQEPKSSEQLQQESELHSLNLFDNLNESILKPLPKCTAQLGSNFGAMSLIPLQTYTGQQLIILYLMMVSCSTKGYVNHVFPNVWESGFQ